MATGSYLEWRAWIAIDKFKCVLNDSSTFISRYYLISYNSIHYTFMLLRVVSQFCSILFSFIDVESKMARRDLVPKLYTYDIL